MYTIESYDRLGNCISDFKVAPSLALSFYALYSDNAVQHKDGRSIQLKYDGEPILTRFAD